jgi:peroxiredoxin
VKLTLPNAAILFFIVYLPYKAWVREIAPEDISAAHQAAAGKTIPALTVKDLSGATHQLNEYLKDEKYILVNFWATWCSGCIAEMPELSRIHNKFYGKGFKVVAVNVDEKADTLNQYLKENNLPFTVVHDFENKAMPNMNMEYLPTSLLINSEREILEKVEDLSELDKKLEKWLAK